MNLIPFSPTTRVNPEDAKNDSIALEIGNWIIEGEETTIADFFGFLGPYPKSPASRSAFTNATSRSLTPELFGWMFNRHAGRNSYIKSLKLRGSARGSGNGEASPLASGALNIFNVSPLGARLTVKRLRFDLKLNVTRFVWYQSWPRLMGEPVESWDWPASTLRKWDRPISDPFEEIVFDSRDNVLLSKRMLSFARPEAWPHHLRRYIEAFEAAAENEFNRAYNETFLQLNPHRRVQRIPAEVYYNLKEVETYWEFESQNPIRQVRALEYALFSYGLRFRSREYPRGRVEAHREGNMRSLLVTLSAGVELRVYAKTSRRIRFEIVHDLKVAAINRLLNAEGNRKTTTNLNELLSWFPILAENAANHLNRVLEYLETESTVMLHSATPYELISKIHFTVKVVERVEVILAILAENGGIQITRNGAVILADVEKLRRAGILKRQGKVDCVTPYYRRALFLLRELI